MKSLVKKYYKRLSPIIMPITMLFFLSIQDRKLKGFALLVGTSIFIFASSYSNKISKS